MIVLQEALRSCAWPAVQASQAAASMEVVGGGAGALTGSGAHPMPSLPNCATSGLFLGKSRITGCVPHRSMSCNRPVGLGFKTLYQEHHQRRMCADALQHAPKGHSPASRRRAACQTANESLTRNTRLS